MSWRALESVLTHSKSKGSRRVLMLILAYHKNDATGLCNPSIQTLAREANIDRTNVQDALKSLETSGEISIISAAGKGQNESNSYLILLPEKPANSGESTAIKSKPNSGKNAQRIEAKSPANRGARAAQTVITKNKNNNGENEVVALSKFDLESCSNYAAHCRKLDPTIRSVSALGKHFYKTGEADSDIEVWLDERARLESAIAARQSQPTPKVEIGDDALNFAKTIAPLIASKNELSRVLDKANSARGEKQFDAPELDAALRKAVHREVGRVDSKHAALIAEVLNGLCENPAHL